MNTHIFAKSPFALTASKDISACWAGRPEVREHLKRLQSAYVRRSDSSLDVMWANLGAGKSHVLFHLAYLLTHDALTEGKMVPLVLEMPEQVKSFIDLYRRIIPKFAPSQLGEILATLPSENPFRELKQAGQALLHGGAAEKEVAWEWVSGGRPHLTDLRRCTNIGRRIEDDNAATDALCGIVKAFANRQIRVVLLIDEFQRLAVLKKSARDALLSSLRSLFSRSPDYFSVLLASALRMEQNALDLLSAELRTLLGHRPTISLPEMSETEALDFVLGRFDFFRPTGFESSFAPFSEESVATIIEVIKTKGRPLIPREILQALSYCYDEFGDTSNPISSTQCGESLEKLKWDET